MRESGLQPQADCLFVRTERAGSFELREYGAQQATRCTPDAWVLILAQQKRTLQHRRRDRWQHLRESGEELGQSLEGIVPHVAVVVVELREQLARGQLAVAQRLALVLVQPLVSQHD